MHSLIDIVRLSKQYVNGGRPDFEVEEWIAFCLKLKRFDLYIQYDRPLEKSELFLIREGLKSLKFGTPLAYITHTVHFWKSDFYCNSDVLIPRPETELLVEHALRLIRECKYSSVADVCTGSGCIGLSLKREMPLLRVCLCDLSFAALEIARKNALSDDVVLRQGDLLEPLLLGEVDLVVANPPYLSIDEWNRMDASVRNFEPSVALVGGVSGVEPYERLVLQAVDKRVKALVVEIGDTQKDQVLSIFKKGGAASVDCFKDFLGKDRVITAHFFD